jgi:LCP family protein required for cell wall assembly
MADDGHGTGEDADPFERYFRPRPGGAGGEPGSGGFGSSGFGSGGFGSGGSSSGGSGSGSGDDDIEGVTVDGVPSPRVAVETPRGPRRPGRELSPRAAMSARRQRRFLMITGTMSAFVLLTSGGAWAFQNYVTGAIDKVKVGGLGKDKEAPKGAMTILVAGVDRREGLTKAQQKAAKLGHEPGERSDTMLLVHVSRDHDKVTVINLPRDSYVMIPAHRSNGSEPGGKGAAIPARYGKLTWAYQFGGRDLMVDTIKRATGVSIDHLIEVNFYGFVNMVNSLGGVEVCSEEPVDDAKSGLKLPAPATPSPEAATSAASTASSSSWPR